MSTATRFGKYDLLALLATGGMAEIWLARISGMAGFEKLVVIKRLLDKLAIDPSTSRCSSTRRASTRG